MHVIISPESVKYVYPLEIMIFAVLEALARPAPATMLEMMSAVFLVDHKKKFFCEKYFPALCTALQPRSSRAESIKYRI